MYYRLKKDNLCQRSNCAFLYTLLLFFITLPSSTVTNSNWYPMLLLLKQVWRCHLLAAESPNRQSQTSQSYCLTAQLNAAHPKDRVSILSGLNHCRFLTGIRIGDCPLVFVEGTAYWNRLLGRTDFIHLCENIHLLTTSFVLFVAYLVPSSVFSLPIGLLCTF